MAKKRELLRARVNERGNIEVSIYPFGSDAQMAKLAKEIGEVINRAFDETTHTGFDASSPVSPVKH